jgi:phage/plasmid primase-like uncharacterized protein
MRNHNKANPDQGHPPIDRDAVIPDPDTIQDYERQFSDALALKDYGEHHIPADGEWHDIAFPDSKRRKKNGAAKLTFGKDGVVIDRRNPAGNKPIFIWKPEAAVKLTAEQREELERQNAARAAELKALQEEARLNAIKLFERLPDASAEHRYLVKKGIKNTFPLKKDDEGWLVVPIYNGMTGELQTLQRIDPTGRKQFPRYGVTTGGCAMPGAQALVGLEGNDDPIVIAEGYATAEAIHRATGWPTLAAMNCGNLKAVAEAMRQRFPKRQIILAADNDKSGVGIEAANKAAQAVDGKVATPGLADKDFSDLLVRKGVEAVESIIKNAAAPPEQDADSDDNDDNNQCSVNRQTPLPVIQVKAHEGPAIAKRAEEILLEIGAEIYQRGGVLVRHIIEEADASHGRKTKVARLVEITAVYLRNELGKIIRWERYDKHSKKWVQTAVPNDVAHVILSQVGHWTFPTIAGVITTPTMRPDGSLLLTLGYDEVTRLLLVAPPPMPQIPDQPTREDALAALALLEDLLEEFPFVDEVSKAVALSAMITPVARGAYPIAPMHSMRAPTSSSGKSFLLDIVATICIGQLMPVLAAGRTEEETEKRLGAALISGQPLISIDNVNGELGGDALCQMVERPIVEIRILQKSELVRIEARGTSMFCTGNNIIIVADLVRRVLTAMLDTKLENPEQREFKKDPVAMVLEDRGKYIAACLTICRAYIIADYPDKAKRLPSFEPWSDIVRSALMWLGKADPVSSIETSRAEDPTRNELRDILAAWAEVIGIGENCQCTVPEVIKLAKEDDGTYGTFGSPRYPEFHDAVQAVAGRKSGASDRSGPIDAGALGRWLQRRKNVPAGGLRFTNKPGSRRASWWIEHIGGKAAEDTYRAEQEAEQKRQEAEQASRNEGESF